LIGAVAGVGLCIGGWVLLWYAGLPRLREGVQAGLADGIGTEVAARLPTVVPGEIGPGSYVVTAEELERALGSTVQGGTVQGITVDFSPSGLALGVRTEGGQTATYTGVPAVEDGRLVLRDMRSDSDVLDLFLPAEDLGAAIADGVNRTLAAQDLLLDGVELGVGRLELHLVPSP
jgi:hypothetical protein